MAAGLFDAARYTTSRSRFARAAVMCGVAGGPAGRPIVLCHGEDHYRHLVLGRIASRSHPPGQYAKCYRYHNRDWRQVERNDGDAETNPDSCENEEGGYKVSDQGGCAPKHTST